MLIHGSVNEVLGVAFKVCFPTSNSLELDTTECAVRFKLPKFAVYQAICDVFRNGTGNELRDARSGYPSTWIEQGTREEDIAYSLLNRHPQCCTPDHIWRGKSSRRSPPGVYSDTFG